MKLCEGKVHHLLIIKLVLPFLIELENLDIPSGVCFMENRNHILLIWFIYSMFSDFLVATLSLALRRPSLECLCPLNLVVPNPAIEGLFTIPLFLLPYAYLSIRSLFVDGIKRSLRWEILCFFGSQILMIIEIITFTNAWWHTLPSKYVMLLGTTIFALNSGLYVLYRNKQHRLLLYAIFILSSVFPYLLLTSGFSVGYPLLILWFLVETHRISQRKL